MSDSVDKLQKLLRSRKYSLTAARRAVFSALGDSKGPLSMHDLIAVCSPEIDRASVYRTVSLFEELGVVQRLQIGWKYKLELSDEFSHHHHHVSCAKCGRTVATDDDAVLEERIRALAIARGFTATTHQLEILGVCEDCRLKQA